MKTLKPPEPTTAKAKWQCRDAWPVCIVMPRWISKASPSSSRVTSVATATSCACRNNNSWLLQPPVEQQNGADDQATEHQRVAEVMPHHAITTDAVAPL